MQADRLAGLVSNALGCDRPRILEYRSVPLDYDPFLPGRTLTRWSGLAVADGELRTWSMIEKTTDGPRVVSPWLYENARRELAAYRSGILDRSTPSFAAARALGHHQHDDGRITLWLEDLKDDHGGAWPLEEYRRAARHLGQFNGGYLTGEAIPPDDWLFTGWTDRHGQPARIADSLVEVAALGTLDAVTRALGSDVIARGERLLHDQRAVVAMLAALPQTLCHHDAVRSNLFSRLGSDGIRQTVAIDWESVGPGSLGADIASLVFSSVRRGELSAEVLSEVTPSVLDGYVEGLRDMGWDGAPALVRLGFCAAVALRWSLLRDVLVILGQLGPRAARGRAPHETHEESLAQLITLTHFLLDTADEARALAKSGLTA